MAQYFSVINPNDRVCYSGHSATETTALDHNEQKKKKRLTLR